MAISDTFTTNTDACTHDSDPKLLNFQLIDGQSPGEGTVEVNLGATLDLTSAYSPGTESGEIAGPTIGQLIGGGSTGPQTLTPDMLTEGTVTFQVVWSDESSTTYTMTAAEFKALADAQGQGSSSSGVIITDFDIASKIGFSTSRTYENVTVVWTSSPTTINKTSSVLTLLLVSNVGDTKADMGSIALTDGNSVDTTYTPGTVAAGDTLQIAYTLVGEDSDTRNRLDLVLNPHICNKRVTTGELTVTFTCDDGGDGVVYGPLTLHAADFEAWAATHGQSYLTSTMLPSSELTDWLSALTTAAASGLPIISLTAQVVTPFATSDLNPTMTLIDHTQIAVGWNITDPLLDWHVLIDTSILTPQTYTFSPQAIPQNFFALRPYGHVGAGSDGWESSDSTPLTITIGLSAPELLLNASPEQLESQNATITLESYIGSYYGFTFADSVLYSSSDYGPDPLMNDPRNVAIALYINGEGGTAGAFAVLNPLLPIHGTRIPSLPGSPIEDNYTIAASIDLYPKDVPIYRPFVMTEPYEIRQRNRPAFKFRGVNIPALEGGAKLTIIMFVSQGSPTPLADNSDRMWTECPWDYVSGNLSDKETNGVINLNSTIINFPANYGGAIVIPAPEYNGPYNYIRFALWVDDPTQYTGATLQITANAREL